MDNQSPTISYQPTSSSSTPAVPPSDTPPSKKITRKALGAILSVLVLVAGIATSIFLVQRQQKYAVGAWDCNAYNFAVSLTGQVTATNQSTRNEPTQQASVTIAINGVEQSAGIFTVPELAAGASATLGNVNVPAGGGFTWKVVGTKDCQDTGNYPTVQASCPPYSVEPKTGNWSNPDKFIYKNKSSSPITINWQVVCQKDKDPVKCKANAPADQSGTETLQPSQTVERGFGKICAPWQLDLTSTNPNCPQTGYVAQPENCSAPSATPRPTTTPVPTVRPSATPRPTASPTPTPTRIPSPTPTTPPGQPTNTPAPTATPGPTSTPNPTPTSPPTAGEPNKCNGTCGSNANCNPGLVCYLGYCRNQDNPTDTACNGKTLAACNGFCNGTNDCSSGLTCTSGKCRNAQNPNSTDCANKTIATGGSNPIPTPVTALPKSGGMEYTWMLGIGGLAILGLGALLAL